MTFDQDLFGSSQASRRSQQDEARLIRSILSGLRYGLEDVIPGIVEPVAGGGVPPPVKSALLQLEEIRISFSPAHPMWRAGPVEWPHVLLELRRNMEILVADDNFRDIAIIAPFRLSPSKQVRDQLLEVDPEFLQKINVFDAAHLLIRRLSGSIHTPSSQPSDVAELRRIIPPQKVAPIQFEIRDGRLALQRKISATAAKDRATTEIAREELLRGGQRILTELRNSNCDRRLVESLEYLQDQLLTGESIIRVGLSNIGCEMMCGVYEAELPEAVASMIRSHTRGVDMFAAQFPEWNRFVENAAAVQINDDDVAAIYDTTQSLVRHLNAEDNLVDPEVPRTLARLNNLISNPRNASKRAAFAILRSIENLVSKVFSLGADLMEKTVAKTIDGLSTVASKALIVGLLTIALTGASSIGPIAAKVKEMAWLKSASELVQRQIDRMLKE